MAIADIVIGMRRDLPGLIRLLIALSLCWWAIAPKPGGTWAAPFPAAPGFDAARSETPICGSDAGHAAPDGPTGDRHPGCPDLCCRMAPWQPIVMGIGGAPLPVPAFHSIASARAQHVHAPPTRPLARPRSRAPPIAVL